MIAVFVGVRGKDCGSGFGIRNGEAIGLSPGVNAWEISIEGTGGGTETGSRGEEIKVIGIRYSVHTSWWWGAVGNKEIE